MDPFDALVSQARDKRDAIIRAARTEYGQAKNRINSLRLQIRGTAAPKIMSAKLVPIVDIITASLPHDRAFTVVELLEMLTVAEPGRTFQMDTVREYCQRLAERGIVRRVGRVGGKVCWAAADYTGPVDALCSKRLPEIVAGVLRESGPLRTMDLLARIQERGYRTTDDHRHVMRALRMSLWRCDIFERDKTGRWLLRETTDSPVRSG